MGLQCSIEQFRNFSKKNLDPRLIIWAWGALEADFWRFYKIDINNESSLTLRKFLVFIRGLPDDSAFKAWANNKDNRNFVEFEEVEI